MGKARILGDRDIVICGFATLDHVRNSGRSALDLSGQVFDKLLLGSGLDRNQIDGFTLTIPMSEGSNPFWSNVVLESLGICSSWTQITDIGGASSLGNIVRAGAAIKAGLCDLAVCISADAVSNHDRTIQRGHRTDLYDPFGYAGPVTQFGLISAAYNEVYGLPSNGMARLAVAQRNNAQRNPITVKQMRSSITTDEYLASKFIAEPLRLLDCVMRCDGASAFIVTTRAHAAALGLEVLAVPIAYREVSNHDPLQQLSLIDSGFSTIGQTIWDDCGLHPEDIDCFQPYDDFLIAVMMQIEQLGFCPVGQSGAFLKERDLHWSGDFPINTGGGQISCGQPGNAGGALNLGEAVLQLSGQATNRQVVSARYALVTGIGVMQYAKNWGVSNAMILEAPQ